MRLCFYSVTVLLIIGIDSDPTIHDIANDSANIVTKILGMY